MASAQEWITAELGNADFGDERLTKRLLLIGRRLLSRCGENISSSFSSWKDIKASYRFFSNGKVNSAAILGPHIAETLARVREQERVLLIQDTTYLAFTNRPKTQGLDMTNGNRGAADSEDSQGLMLHNSFAVSDSGLPLGLIDQHYIDRKQLLAESHQAKRKLRHWDKCVKEKESIRWINSVKKATAYDLGDTQVIHVADRESDFYEFFRDATQLGAQVLIRAARNRAINKAHRRDPGSTYLFDHLKSRRAQGKMAIQLQVNGPAKYREAKVSIIYAPISMPAPPNKTATKDGCLPPVDLFAIMVVERHPPKADEPLCWVLLTNLAVADLESAKEKIHWYTLRWNIELFHKVLKSGCGVEKAQLRDADRLKNYISLKSVIAWRLFWLSRYYREQPQESCLNVLTQQEWQILYRKMTRVKTIPDQPPNVQEVFIWIAKLGGYIGRRSDHPPGMISIWKGWQRLMDMVQDYRDICG